MISHRNQYAFQKEMCDFDRSHFSRFFFYYYILYIYILLIVSKLALHCANFFIQFFSIHIYFFPKPMNNEINLFFVASFTSMFFIRCEFKKTLNYFFAEFKDSGTWTKSDYMVYSHYMYICLKIIL